VKYISLLFAFCSLLCLFGCTTKAPKPKKDTTLVIGTELEYPPFSYMQKKEVVGFDIDVIKEACQRIHRTCKLKPIPNFDALIPELTAGNIDVIAAGMTPTPERAKRVLFTQPHYEGKGFLVISFPSIGPIRTVNDLQGHTVAINEGYASETFLLEVPDVTLLRLGTPAEALLALKSGQADAYLIAEAPAKNLLKTYPLENFTITTLDAYSEGVAFAVNKNNQELCDELNEAIEEMRFDGTLRELEKKWGLE